MPAERAPYIYPRWPVLGSGTTDAGQLTTIRTTCREVARLVLLSRATSRAIRSTGTTSRASSRGKSCDCRTTGESYDQPWQWRTTQDLSHDHRTTVARQMKTRLRQDATTSVAARFLNKIKNLSATDFGRANILDYPRPPKTCGTTFLRLPAISSRSLVATCRKLSYLLVGLGLNQTQKMSTWRHRTTLCHPVAVCRKIRLYIFLL
jgi:hypothetical protein